MESVTIVVSYQKCFRFRPDFDEIVCESVSSSLDDNTDQGASEIGLLTESSTATAQTAHCNVPVAASFSIGKALRSKTLKTVPKSPPMLENFWISGPHTSSGCAMTTRGQSNLTKSASRGAHSPVRGHPRGSKVVPLNSCGRVSY